MTIQYGNDAVLSEIEPLGERNQPSSIHLSCVRLR
jgi:hypothetical protein